MAQYRCKGSDSNNEEVDEQQHPTFGSKFRGYGLLGHITQRTLLKKLREGDLLGLYEFDIVLPQPSYEPNRG